MNTYFNLRDYGVDGQLGMESSPHEFVAKLVEVFREIRRVMRKDAVAFVNLGDSYSGSGKGPSSKNGITKQHSAVGSLIGPTPRIDGIPPKNLMLIPERFAIAMQDDGWIVRSQIVWAKTSAMPESVRDRPTSAWEPIWMFAKSRTYFYDADAVRTPLSTRMPGSTIQETQHYGAQNGGNTGLSDYLAKFKSGEAAGANLRNVWSLSPEPLRESHYASFPTEIPRRCILAGTSEKGACGACGAPWRRVVESDAPGRRVNGTRPSRVVMRDGWIPQSAIPEGRRTATVGWEPGCSCDAGEPVAQTVLDPFGGSGTTGLVADRLGRDAILIELSPTYAEMSRKRIEADAGPLMGETVTVEAPRQLALADAVPLGEVG